MSYTKTCDGLGLLGTNAIKALEPLQRTGVAFGNHFSNISKGNYSGHLELHRTEQIITTFQPKAS